MPELDGSVSAGQATNPVLVGLVRHDGGDLENRANWSLVDHFVLESPGRWMFRAGPGTYGLVAFVDLNADGVYQPGEPFMPVDTNELVTCDSRHTHSELALFITAEGRSRIEGEIDFMKFQARTASAQLNQSLGAMTAYGVVTTFEDPRFREEHATNSLWRPYDFIFDVGPGVYFLEPYDAHKIPVLFVHGINGTPTNFRYLGGAFGSNEVSALAVLLPVGRPPLRHCRPSRSDDEGRSSMLKPVFRCAEAVPLVAGLQHPVFAPARAAVALEALRTPDREPPGVALFRADLAHRAAEVERLDDRLLDQRVPPGGSIIAAATSQDAMIAYCGDVEVCIR